MSYRAGHSSSYTLAFDSRLFILGKVSVLIFRYLAKEILFNTFAVAIILLLIVVSGRFVKYLAEASSGRLEAELIFAIIGFRIPGFLELIFPLAFFIGILLSYGRLYIDNEMTIFTACGMGPGKLVQYTLSVAVMVALFVGWMSLSVSPSGVAKADELLNAQKQRSDIEKLLPRQFLPLNDGKSVTYTENVTEEGDLKDIFLVEASSNQTDLVMIVAKNGSQQQGTGGFDYLVLEQGYRIRGKPGFADYEITRFSEYGQRIAKHNQVKVPRADAIATNELIGSSDLESIAAYQWRLSIPMLVMVVALLAVPLSRANPRQGRYVSMLPAVMVYIVYLVSLNGARTAVEDGSLPVFPGLWMVHMIFFGLALLLLLWPMISRKVRSPSKLSIIQKDGSQEEDGQGKGSKGPGSKGEDSP